MAEDEFKKKVLKSLEKIQGTQGKIQSTQGKHTEMLKKIDVSLKVSSRFICGTLLHSLEEIEKATDTGPTDFQGGLEEAKKAALG